MCHMGAHALGAAAYAAKAAGLVAPDRPEATKGEIRWQLTHMSRESGPPCEPSRPSARTGQGLSAPGSSHQVSSARSSVTSKPVSPSSTGTDRNDHRCGRNATGSLPRAHNPSSGGTATSIVYRDGQLPRNRKLVCRIFGVGRRHSYSNGMKRGLPR
ncbi:MAG: putative immunity protein [Acidimicrobiales bacterium]